MSDFKDLDQAIEESHAAVDAFARGDAEPLKALYSHGDDATIANPFGPPVRGWPGAAETMTRAATYYRDGLALGFDRVSECKTPALAYVVEMERIEAKIGGSSERTPVTLRVTTVFRPEDGRWKIVHRHADPIATARSADSVIQG
jgi:ketosteroid isomerase-like protein